MSVSQGRRSHAFNPSVSGLEQLERLRLLSSSPHKLLPGGSASGGPGFGSVTMHSRGARGGHGGSESGGHHGGASHGSAAPLARVGHLDAKKRKRSRISVISGEPPRDRHANAGDRAHHGANGQLVTNASHPHSAADEHGGGMMAVEPNIGAEAALTAKPRERRNHDDARRPHGRNGDGQGVHIDAEGDGSALSTSTGYVPSTSQTDTVTHLTAGPFNTSQTVMGSVVSGPSTSAGAPVQGSVTPNVWEWLSLFPTKLTSGSGSAGGGTLTGGHGGSSTGISTSAWNPGTITSHGSLSIPSNTGGNSHPAGSGNYDFALPAKANGPMTSPAGQAAPVGAAPITASGAGQGAGLPAALSPEKLLGEIDQRLVDEAKLYEKNRDALLESRAESGVGNLGAADKRENPWLKLGAEGKLRAEQSLHAERDELKRLAALGRRDGLGNAASMNALLHEASRELRHDRDVHRGGANSIERLDSGNAYTGGWRSSGSTMYEGTPRRSRPSGIGARTNAETDATIRLRQNQWESDFEKTS